MRYHEGNKRGVIPHPATVTILCLKAGVKGAWEIEEEFPLTSPLLLTGVSKGPRNQKKKGVLIKTREEALLSHDQNAFTNRLALSPKDYYLNPQQQFQQLADLDQIIF